MDRILIILKKKEENGPRASSAPALGLNTIIFKHVYWYMQQISGERLQDHWSSCLINQCLSNWTLNSDPAFLWLLAILRGIKPQEKQSLTFKGVGTLCGSFRKHSHFN